MTRLTHLNIITDGLTDLQALVILVQLNIVVTLVILQHLARTLAVDGINTLDNGGWSKVGLVNSEVRS